MQIQQFIEFLRDYCHPNHYELKPYVIQDGKRHPAAIICPGGAYGMVCNFMEGEPYARKLNAMGISAFVLYYHVRKKARFPAPQNDLARAVREIHSRADEWMLDVERYSIWGSSAGGHLAASFGTDSMGYVKYGLPKPGAIILCYPVVTMGDQTHGGTRSNLLGSDPAHEVILSVSNEKQITAGYPPTFLWSGDADRTVSVENSRMLASALQEASVFHRYVEYPGVDHGVGLGENLVCVGWIEEAADFWLSQRKKN